MNQFGAGSSVAPVGSAISAASLQGHIEASDPHAQYLNATRGDARYARVGGSSGQLQYNSGSGLGGTAGGFYASSGFLFTISAQAPTDTPLALKGASSQAANLQEWQSSSGAAKSYVDASGNFGLVDTNIIGSSSVGTQIGTSSDQKYGFFGKTPIPRQANTAGSVSASSAWGANEQAMLNDCYGLLMNLGLLST